MRRLIVFILMSLCTFSLFAQKDIYDERVALSNNLYKVKSGPFYGIVDNADRVLVSVEYDNLNFNEGKALLLKNGVLHGWVDSLGKVQSCLPIFQVHNKFAYFSCNYILVKNKENMWGYMGVDRKYLNYLDKERRKEPLCYYLAFPFIEGMAVVFSDKYGWQHIDNKDGGWKFFGTGQEEVLFRSSVYKGECIIVTSSGIKQYQLSETGEAVVKRVLSLTATPVIEKANTPKKGSIFAKKKVSLSQKVMEYMKDMPDKLVFEEGTLEFDSLMRVKRFVSPGNSVEFIEPPKPEPIVRVVKVKAPEKTLADVIQVQLVKNTISTCADGYATAKITLRNTTGRIFEGLSAELECGGRTKTWNGTLSPYSTVTISISFPARFSQNLIKRELITTIKYGKKEISNAQFVTIKRYVPSNR